MLSFKPQNAKSAASLEEATRQCADPIMELKYDGWRLIVIVGPNGPTLWSRTGKEYTGRVPKIEQELGKLPVGTILDGEIVDLDTHNYISVTNVFGKSKAVATDEERARLSYVAFDILSFGDDQVATKSFRERRQILVDALKFIDLVEVSRWHPIDEEVLDEIYDGGYEGVVVKDAAMPYMKGKRGHGWFKIKATEETDVIITGLPKNGNGKYFGQVGHVEVSQYQDGELVQVATVNCPDDKTRLEMTADPDAFLGKVFTLKHYGKIIDGFRHPNFVKWREDKPQEDCVVGN